MNVKESTNRPTNFIGVSDMFGVKWRQILKFNFLQSSLTHTHYHISLSHSISYLLRIIYIYFLPFLWILSLHAPKFYFLFITK